MTKEELIARLNQYGTESEIYILVASGELRPLTYVAQAMTVEPEEDDWPRILVLGAEK
jgi:hypothetical protein